MAGVPITFYLERRSREKSGLSGEASALDIQTATEIWYDKGLREGMEQAKAACDAKLAAREEECKQWIEAARKAWTVTEGAVLARQIAGAASSSQDGYRGRGRPDSKTSRWAKARRGSFS